MHDVKFMDEVTSAGHQAMELFLQTQKQAKAFKTERPFHLRKRCF